MRISEVASDLEYLLGGTGTRQTKVLAFPGSTIGYLLASTPCFEALYF
jgi:hypothetical protein